MMKSNKKQTFNLTLPLLRMYTETIGTFTKLVYMYT